MQQGVDPPKSSPDLLAIIRRVEEDQRLTALAVTIGDVVKQGVYTLFCHIGIRLPIEGGIKEPSLA
jgi:hypothetical protein